MHVTEKLIKPLTEAKYLNADNVDRYRSIMRIFQNWQLPCETAAWQGTRKIYGRCIWRKTDAMLSILKEVD